MSQVDFIIKTYDEHHNIPHILIYGDTNSGKRGVLNKILNHIYSYELKKQYCMYIQCATCKGIKMIRDDIKEFAKQNANPVYFKSIILYDADNLTIDAQYSLRRCIEIYSKNTRFFIVTSNKDKLLNPICSRFIHMYVQSVNKKRVIPNISINIENKNVDELIIMSEELYNSGVYGDMILKQMKKMNKNEYIYIKFYYETICKELRNEPLIIFYLLCYWKKIINIV
jgi:DNA polymerase III delta prime subunit